MHLKVKQIELQLSVRDKCNQHRTQGQFNRNNINLYIIYSDILMFYIDFIAIFKWSHILSIMVKVLCCYYNSTKVSLTQCYCLKTCTEQIQVSSSNKQGIRTRIKNEFAVLRPYHICIIFYTKWSIIIPIPVSLHIKIYSLVFQLF